jgi:hypothetical protein
MRFREFKLFEYDQSKTLAAYGAKLNQDPIQAQAILTNIESIDPTRNKQYVVWLVKQHLAGQPVVGNAAEVTELLTNFERLKPRLDQKDINRYSLEQLSATITAVMNPDLGSDTQGKYEVPEGTKILYNGPYGLLTMPTTHQASCELGSGTMWCTTEKSSEHFDRYSTNGDLYIWRDRSGEKFQFWVATDEGYASERGKFLEFSDAQNKMASANPKFDQVKNNPVLLKFFDKIFKQLLQTFPDAEFVKPWIKELGSVPQFAMDSIEKNPELAIAMVLAGVKDTRIAASVAKTPSTAYTYARYIRRKPWRAGEPAIVTDPSYAYSYANDVLKRRWPEAEDIIKESEFAMAYAINVVKGPWPEAEHTILKSPRQSATYAIKAIKGRWPKGEPVIYQGKYSAEDYDKFLNSLK